MEYKQGEKKMSTVLTKEVLRSLKGQDVKTKDVPVPEWGRDAVVRVCVMSGASQEEFEGFVESNRVAPPPDQTNNEQQAKSAAEGTSSVLTEGMRWVLLRHTVVDGDNNLLFDSQEEVKEIIGPLNGSTIMDILMASLELNGFTGKAVEQAEKNSSTTRQGGTGTGSRGNAGGASRKRNKK